MTKEQVNRIVNTLENGERSFYVYALCKENESKPFYIGKGRADRVEAHLRDAREVLKDLKADSSIMTKEELEAGKKALSRKIDTIIKSNCAIRHVIVKWGLTAPEAYMCESALINMLKFLGVDLTNIVNGHASDPEKKCKADIKTKALTLDEFLSTCALEKKCIEDLKGKKLVLITINRLYPKCVGKESVADPFKVKEAVSAFWSIASDKAKAADYVIALYRQKVVGVFKVKGAETISELRNNKFDGFPVFPEEDRRMDRFKCAAPTLLEAQKVLKPEEYDELVWNLGKGSKDDAEKGMKNFQRRVLFKLDDNVPDKVSAYLNCILTENGTTDFLTTGHALYGGPILRGF